ncbi:hypothetical protein AX16_000999 [Volvariella volvacea WC 439]|nr:hypothetical protein AX16_000999 [Volvariella volvacea WC 439]
MVSSLLLECNADVSRYNLEQTRPNDQQPEAFYHNKAREFVELHEQVQTSVNLLDSLESFLSTFQKDLSAVSGQISELQDRSKDIDNRLRSRRRIEKPLSNLITDLTIPPSLAKTILDTEVSEQWNEAIEDFERRMETVKSRTRVKAARDLSEVAEGLRIVAATKLRSFFLALFQPIRSSVTTNMQVMQTSIILKYAPLFSFLQRQAPNVAQELQRSYIGAARVYYETGFRRYARSLTAVKARTIEKFTLITAKEESPIDPQRLAHASIDGPGVTLSYMADDRNHKEPLEALWRSLLLVFMDNATSEYAFIAEFFLPPSSCSDIANSSLSPTALLSPERTSFQDSRSISGSELATPRAVSNPVPIIAQSANATKQDKANLDSIWKQIFDPVLEYTQAFLRSTLDPTPPTVPLLTMIRLTEDVATEIQKRSSPPVETFVYALRIQMWPIFQKTMSEHIEALKKLAEGGSLSYFSRTSSITDSVVSEICNKYTALFNAFIGLTSHEEETMIFSKQVDTVILTVIQSNA